LASAISNRSVVTNESPAALAPSSAVAEYPCHFRLHVDLSGPAFHLGDLGEQRLGGLIGRFGPTAGVGDEAPGEAVGFLEQDLEQVLGRQLLVRLAMARDWADWIACLARSE